MGPNALFSDRIAERGHTVTEESHIAATTVHSGTATVFRVAAITYAVDMTAHIRNVTTITQTFEPTVPSYKNSKAILLL